MTKTTSSVSQVVMGIDIGEINMGICILKRENKISTTKCEVIAWDVFSTKDNTPIADKCVGKMANGNDCTFKSQYETSKVNVFACKRHSDTKVPRKKTKSKKTPLDVLALNVNKALDKFAIENKVQLSQVTHVGIERQVKQNATAITISHYVLFYFTQYFRNLQTSLHLGQKATPVQLISAKKKFTIYNDDGPPIAKKYKDAKKQRKYWSVQVGNYLIANPENSKIIFTEKQQQQYNHQIKRDDWAESCFLSYCVIMNKSETINF